MYCLTSLGYSKLIISVKSRVATRGGKDGTYQDDSTETWLHSTSLWLWDVIWCFFLFAYVAISSICVCLCCQELFIYYIYTCLYIYVHSENCCWVGGRSNIRCVYIYITIYTHIYTYIPTYTTPIDAFVDFMPVASFRKSAGNKGREELNAKAGRKQAEIPRKSWCGSHIVHVLRILRSKPYQYTTKRKQGPFENLYRDLDVSQKNIGRSIRWTSMFLFSCGHHHFSVACLLEFKDLPGRNRHVFRCIIHGLFFRTCFRRPFLIAGGNCWFVKKQVYHPYSKHRWLRFQWVIQWQWWWVCGWVGGGAHGSTTLARNPWFLWCSLEKYSTKNRCIHPWSIHFNIIQCVNRPVTFILSERKYIKTNGVFFHIYLRITS